MLLSLLSPLAVAIFLLSTVFLYSFCQQPSLSTSLVRCIALAQAHLIVPLPERRHPRANSAVEKAAMEGVPASSSSTSSSSVPAKMSAPEHERSIPLSSAIQRTSKRRSIQIVPPQSLDGLVQSHVTSPIASSVSPPLPLTAEPLVSSTATASSSSAEPEDQTAFLTALAAQERRVLELKEELEKAESDLERLKRRWAVREAGRKKNELRHVQQLQALSPTRRKSVALTGETSTMISTREGGATTKWSEEARRQGLGLRTPGSDSTGTAMRAKQSKRKVFEGGRHTRTLSLLSPSSLASRDNTAPPFKPAASGDGQTPIESESEGGKTEGRISPTSAPPHTLHHHHHNNRLNLPVAAPDEQQQSSRTREDLVNTGKQFVGDLRDGLWTLIEDLRQATVGDEAISASRSKKMMMQQQQQQQQSQQQSQGQRQGQGQRSSSKHRATPQEDTGTSSRTSNLPMAPPPIPRKTAAEGAPGSAPATPIQQDTAAATSPRQRSSSSAKQRYTPREVLEQEKEEKEGVLVTQNSGSAPTVEPLIHPSPTATTTTASAGKPGTEIEDQDDPDESWGDWGAPEQTASSAVTGGINSAMVTRVSHSNAPSIAESTRRGTFSTTTEMSSARTSMSSDAAATKDKDGRDRPRPRSIAFDEIPWPKLPSRLSPSHLTRTATSLMSEWEKVLSEPGPGSGFGSGSGSSSAGAVVEGDCIKDGKMD